MDQTSVEKPTQVTIIIDYKDRCETIELNAVERVFIESVYNNYNTEYDLVSGVPMFFYNGERIKDINGLHSVLPSRTGCSDRCCGGLPGLGRVRIASRASCRSSI